VALGYATLGNNLTGRDNTALGTVALNRNTTGNNNVGIGRDASFYTTTGSNNVAIGYKSFETNLQGSNATAVGYGAMKNANSSNSAYINSNVAVGYEALKGSTSTASNTGNNNTGIGYQTLLVNSSGNGNSAIGTYALINNTTGSNNTAGGAGALYVNTTGNNNTCFGYNAYPTINNLDNYTGIGYNVGGGTSTSNMVEIGNTSISTIRGQVSFTTYSDKRIKKNIHENVPGLSFINKLRPVTYYLDIHKQNEFIYKNKKGTASNWNEKYDIEKVLQTGFIAQEVEESAKEIGFDFNGVDAPKNKADLYGLRYAEFVVPLVKAVQEQQAIIKSQNIKIKLLENTNTEILKRLELLENK